MEKIAIIYLNAPGMEEQLTALRVPEGMEIQLLSVPASETNLAKAFQQAMEQSDARYKVYISANIEILENDILPRMIEAFQQHPNIGLLGLSGTKRVLTSGITYTSPQRIGIALDEASRPLAGRTAKRPCEDVQVLDGYLLATQQDVAWRKDIVHGSLFLGAAASVEHRRAGYDVAVLAEAAPACRLPDELTADDGEQDAFLDEYSVDLYPLVSVIIPTYQRPDYFRQALASAAGQMYRNLDIFVTDNSHNEETKRVYEKCFADDSRIRYEHHPEYDMWGNWHRSNGYDNPEATYVNWLMDDDLFVPEKMGQSQNLWDLNSSEEQFML
ncbi:MAG: glycosyltransferase [Selenomonas sp.]|nr:glycosyltransferase [Selenomonas sp.]